MSIQLITCPECSTLLLGDALVCYQCHHVFDERTKSLESHNHEVAFDQGQIEACQKCGEKYRTGLVRCWNCGAFTRPEIELLYKKLRESPERQKLFSEAGFPDRNLTDRPIVPNGTPYDGPLEEPLLADFKLGGESDEILTASDEDFGDFELSGDFHLAEAQEDDSAVSSPSAFDSDELPINPTQAATDELDFESDSLPMSLAASDDDELEINVPLALPNEFALKEDDLPTADNDFALPSLDSGEAKIVTEEDLANSEPSEIYSLPSLSGESSEESSDAESFQDQRVSAANESSENQSVASEETLTDQLAPEELTAEDALLKIALEEEQKASQPKKVSKGAQIVVFCPNGCKIKVQAKHRGKMGRCPRCKSVFYVPEGPAKPAAKASSAEITVPASSPEDSAVAPTGGKYDSWLTDVRWHKVNPSKLKLKPGSLENDFSAVDVGFSADEILCAHLIAGGGLFGANEKKKPALRIALLQHLSDGKPADQVPAAAKFLVTRDQLSQIKVVQPTPKESESAFADIPVFGVGRIAVRLPKFEEATQWYLSFKLSEFRKFVQFLAEKFEVIGFGENTEVPLEDQLQNHVCAINQHDVPELQGIKYYKADATLPLKISGWKCGNCGVVLSEEGRTASKLGGANGKGIAKAKCPKCTKPLGENPLYQLESAVQSQPAPL